MQIIQIIHLKLDSGADVTVISKEICEGMRDHCAPTMADKKLYGPCRR